MKSNVKKIHIGGGTSSLVKRITSVVLSLMLTLSLFSVGFDVGAVETTTSPTEETTVVEPAEKSTEQPTVADTTKATEKKRTKNKLKTSANTDKKATAYATSGKCGVNANWSYNSSTKTLAISGTGAMYDKKDYDYWEWNDEYSSDCPGYNLTTENITIDNGITRIGDYAFAEFQKLKNVSIPNTVTSIGEGSFQRCLVLSSISLPTSITQIEDYAFYNCTGLTSITIPNGTQTIGASSFYNCTSLTEVTLPNSITSIGASAFNSCKKLNQTIFVGTQSEWENISIGSYNVPLTKNVVLQPSDSDIVMKCGDNCYASYEDGTLTISGTGAMSFTSNPWDSICTDITDVIVEEGITYVKGFSNCTNLTSLGIPNSVTAFENWCFSSNKTTINVYNTSNTVRTTPLTFNRSVFRLHEINTDIPLNGSAGEHITWLLSNGTLSLTGYGDMYDWNEDNKDDFDGFNGQYSTFHQLAPSIYNITIDNRITSIGEDAFDNCNNVTTLNIPDSVSIIGDSACIGMTNLKQVVFSSSITDIGDFSFQSCTSLKNITIPNGVKHIGYGAFATGCDSIIIIPETVNSIYDGAFNRMDLVSLPIKKLICPVNSYAYNLLTSKEFNYYRNSATEVVGTISTENQLSNILNISKPINTSSKFSKLESSKTIFKKKTNSNYIIEDLTEEEININTSKINCYLIEDVELDEVIIFDEDYKVKLHLNEIDRDSNGSIRLNSNGDISNGECHIISSSEKDIIQVKGDLTIITPGEGQGGIINDNGPIFDVKDGGSLTIENGVYSEDVSEYIANNKVVGKTGNRYTVLNNNTEDLTPENDNHTFVLDNVDTFARQQLLGVQIRPETDKVSQAMRFVSVVRSDLLRGAKDYGFVLAKGKNVENMRTNKNNILADSDNCLKVSAKGSSNTLADKAYSSNNLNEGKYKYLTAAITDIDDDNAAIGAKLYIERQDGTYVYADYTCVSTMGEVKAMAA